MKYLKGAIFFVGGFIFTSGLFFLALLAWGEEFEHAAPLPVDGFFFTGLAASMLVGGIAFWKSARRPPA